MRKNLINFKTFSRIIAAQHKCKYNIHSKQCNDKQINEKDKEGKERNFGHK